MKRLSLFFAGYVFAAASLSAQTYDIKAPAKINTLDFLFPTNLPDLFQMEGTTDLTNNAFTYASSAPTVVRVSKEEAKRVEEKRLSIIQSDFNSALSEIISGNTYDARKIVSVPPKILMKSLSYVETEYPTQVTQFLNYHFFSALISAFQWVGIGATLLFLCRFIRRKTKEIDRTNDFLICVAVLFSWVTLLGCFGTILFGSIGEIRDMAKIKHAPRMYIVEYVSVLANNAENSQPKAQ